MILTLKELANYLRVNERTILRMQRSGQIQGVKIGGQWRFNGSQIDQLFFPGSDSDEGEKIALEDITRTHMVTPLSRVLSESRMIMDMEATNRDEAIMELCSVVQKENLVLAPEDFRNRVTDREKLLSTGVGKGVAIPHPRDPVTTLRASAIIVFGKSGKGINMDAVDGKPVNLFFLLACKDIEIHLQVMGRLAQMLQHDELVKEMNQAEKPEDIRKAAMEFERQEFLKEEPE
mgnify:CR=1 FL=1